MTCPHCHHPRTPSLLAILGLLCVIATASLIAYRHGCAQRERVIRKEVLMPVYYTNGGRTVAVEPDHEGRRR